MLIAEIGVNHGGSMELAFKMIELAEESGADMAKFQLFDVDKIVWPTPEVHQEAIRSVITKEQAGLLLEHGRKAGIEVFFSVFDLERVKWCEEIGVDSYKVASSRAYDPELLAAVWNTHKTVYQSVPSQITAKLGNVGRKPCFLLDSAIHLFCVAEYPAVISYLPTMGADMEYQGFSDHSIGIDAAKVAIAKGAMVVEKHFSIDHKTGMDSLWAMDPRELKELKEWETIATKYL